VAFAIFASSVMVLVALGPLVEKEATATSPIVDPVAPASNDLPRSDSAGIPAETTDSVGGPSPRPGSVTSGLAPQPPMRSSLPANAVPSHLEETAVSFRYTTVAGTYEFPKATPYIASYATPEGETLVTASTFVVIAPGIRPFGHPTVLTASDDRFETRYELGKGPVQVGAVTLTYDFRDDGPPKITAALAQSGSQSWSLTWVSFPIDRVAFGGATPVAFASATSLSRIETPDFRVSVGPDADPARSSRRLVLDWSDAGAGTASVGLFSLEGLAGPAILIEFPARMTIVDPTIVGTSTSSGATNYPIQRKTFEYGGRYWAFWYDGTAIVYASAQFAYANGQNTLTWSVKMTTPSATLPSGANYRGFDVAQRDGTVLIGYHPSGLTSFKILIGKLVGSLITWSGSYTAGSWPTAEGGASSVAIGSDGYYWAAAIGKDGSPTLYVARSTSPGATDSRCSSAPSRLANSDAKRCSNPPPWPGGR